MRRLYSILIVIALICMAIPAKAQAPAAKYYSDTMLFAFGKSYLSIKHPGFDSLMKVLRDNPNYFIRVVGHADTIGKDYSNMELSRRRAGQVARYLSARGLDSVRIEQQWRGYHAPVATNANAEGRRYNRRVNMYVIYSKGKVVPPPAPPTPPAPPIKKDTTTKPTPPIVKKDTLPKLQPKPVTPPKPVLVIDTINYDVNPVSIVCDHQTVIFGKNGTKITIPPKSFDCGENKFTLELKEFGKPDEMVLGKMHTMTKKEVLDVQSIGCLKAYSNGKPMSIKPSADILVELPSISKEKDARIFVAPGTAGNWAWRDYTAGNNIPSYDPEYKRYTMGIHELGCYTVAEKCSNKEKKQFYIDIVAKKLKDKNPQFYFVSRDLNATVNAKKNGTLFRIENICEPGPGGVVGIQMIDGEPYLATYQIGKKQIQQMRKTGRTKAKMKFQRVEKEELPEFIKEVM